MLFSENSLQKMIVKEIRHFSEHYEIENDSNIMWIPLD
jgi:hypothetical protein